MPPNIAYRVHVRTTPGESRGTWATYISAARQGAHLSQIAFARALGIDRATVYRWENGRHGSLSFMKRRGPTNNIAARSRSVTARS